MARGWERASSDGTRFNWQKPGWPDVTVDRAALRDELKAFAAAFSLVRRALQKPQNPTAVMNALVNEAMKTSAIEGVRVDESVVMSSICKALGMTAVPAGFTRDVRAEGVAQMVLSVKDDWAKPISAKLIRSWHGALLRNDSRNITVGDFRSHQEPMQVIRRTAYGEIEVRFEAPPSARVPMEIARFVEKWRKFAKTPEEVALKAALLHPHFESIHPFEDGNGRVGRVLVAKALAEGLGQALVLPVSTVIDRSRKDYYEAIHGASQSLDWTSWAKFFIPVLTETLLDFLSAARFVASKGEYLSRYESKMSERARKVIVRMFRDGPAGVAAGLSAAKWMRMTKVSKPTATRDLAELVATGAIIAEGEGVTPELEKIFHKTIKKVTSDIDELKMNTAIAAMMTMVNEFYANGCTKGEVKTLIMLLSPFAPHIAEEMWELMGFAAAEGKMAMQMDWPTYDESKTVDTVKEMAVQVNGKLKTTITVAVDSDDQTVIDAACADEKVQRLMEGKQLFKTIVVKNKLVNLIIK